MSAIGAPGRTGKTPCNERSILDLFLRYPDLRALHRHRHLVAGAFDPGFLRRRQARAAHRQRHGHRRRLDVGRLVHLDGGADFLSRQGRRLLPDGLDRRLCAAGAAARALPAQVRQVHRPRFHRRPVLFPHRAAYRGVLRDRDFLRLRLRADARRRHRFFPLSRSRYRLRRDDRHGHRLFLRRARRHERHYLHPGRAILRAYLRLHGAGDLHFDPDDRPGDSANRFRLAAHRSLRRRLPARPARRPQRATRFSSLYGRPTQHAGHVLHHCRADDRHRRPAARDHPLFHRAARAGRAQIGRLRADLHRHPLYHRPRCRRLRPHQPDQYRWTTSNTARCRNGSTSGKRPG